MLRFSLQFLLLAVAVLFATAISNGQTPRPSPRPLNLPGVAESDSNERQRDLMNDPMEEMRSRQALKAEQKQHEENVARAREASELGTQVFEAFKANKAIGAEESKKLEKLEKLTKKIRDGAGGEDTDGQELEVPNTLEMAVKKVADLATELRKDIEKTPRKVVSAAVIDQANNLLRLIRYVRKVVR